MFTVKKIPVSRGLLFLWSKKLGSIEQQIQNQHNVKFHNLIQTKNLTVPFSSLLGQIWYKDMQLGAYT